MPFIIFRAVLPEAASTEESLGEVSPSTVILSKLSKSASVWIAFNSDLFIEASIKTKLNKVAKSGLIIPDPFAKPVIDTVLEPHLILRERSLGLVSVVKMDFDAFNQLWEFSFFEAFEKAST